jgi:hypothetical protein
MPAWTTMASPTEQKDTRSWPVASDGCPTGLREARGTSEQQIAADAKREIATGSSRPSSAVRGLTRPPARARVVRRNPRERRSACRSMPSS